jgi:hypothetical protein
MKKLFRKIGEKCTMGITSFMIAAFSFILPGTESFGQEDASGSWEGVFMNDFLVRVNISVIEASEFEGNIKMFAGDNLIQDDALRDLRLTDRDLEFYIPAKETSFEGSFDDLWSELTGVLVFPDGSRHDLLLKRNKEESKSNDDFVVVKEKKIDSQDLRSDLLFLYTTLQEQHPQLYAFTPKESFDRRFGKINESLKEPLTMEEFYFQTTRLTDAVKCSHTGAKLPSTYRDLIRSHGRHFPLKLFFKNGRAFYVSGASEGSHSLTPGDEVIGIDGKRMSEIIEDIFCYIPAEGCNETTKYNEINKRFNSLFYFVNDSDEFRVDYLHGDSSESITVSSVGPAELEKHPFAPENESEVIFKPIEHASAGLLKISSFAIPDMDLYFDLLDRIFRGLEENKVENLVIDLRDNAGGHPIFAAQLFSYLTDKEFVYFKRNQEVKDFEPLYNAMQPNEVNYKGNIYVLVNGGCLSTTGHLISLIKSNTEALFVGEQPGSTFRCNDFSTQVTLPNSGIEINVPRTTFETSVTGFELCRPFPIDYKINTEVSDLINHKDIYIEMVQSILE